MAKRKSPRDATCVHCGRKFTKGGLKQHLRYVRCSPTSKASPRKFERVRCKHCNKSFHSTNSLRVHVATVHPKEYAQKPGHMKYHRVPPVKKRSHEHAFTPHAQHGARSLPHHAERFSQRDGLQESRHVEHHTKRKSGETRDRPKPTWGSTLAKQIAEAAKHV